MVATNPTHITGPWKEGFVLDRQIVFSEFIGYDEYGHAMFNTKRTELGELLYRLKYRAEVSVIPEIIDTAAKFFQAWKPPVSLIIPVPPSQPRSEQPVIRLATDLGKQLAVPVSWEAVRKEKKTPQLKNVHDYKQRASLLKDVFSSNPAAISGKGVLLFDDLYQSGATMCAVTNSLYLQGHAHEVYVMALTRSQK